MSGSHTIASWVPRPHSAHQSYQNPVAQPITSAAQPASRTIDAYAARHTHKQDATAASLSPDERCPSPSGRPSPNFLALRSPAMGRPVELSVDEDRSVRSRLQNLKIDEERFLAKPRVIADMFEDAKHFAQGAHRPGDGHGLLPSAEIRDKN